ncbi:MAG TPA: efflux RND transporter periplasmic adaptor subunit [Vicinamibacterales bacterium]|nr:efflux RND transporter periplasmic adaptor subunit [Vicinamibacterales bacterium]
MKRRTASMVAVLLVAGGSGWYWVTREAEQPPDVRTAAISRGAIVQVVKATGAVDAMQTVTVGSQVSGVVSWLGADFNSTVKKGQVIARLEPSLLAAQVEQAQANLTKARADAEQRAITVRDAETKYSRARQLDASQLLSRSDLDDAKSTLDVARASVAGSEAQVVQAEAALNQARVNLGHATITAPIDGIVIQRSVDVGQTVAASLSSPTIFLIAADLAEMRVAASVDESDVSRVREGQPVIVTVDAYPGERFRGTVAQVRLQAMVVSNVTTYSAIVDLPNRDLKLKPGMTANVEIETARRDNVLRVPAAALRFKPTAEIYAALKQPEPAANADAVRVRSARTNAPDAVRAPAAAPASRAQLWAMKDAALQSVPVRIGLSDGTLTELVDAPLEAGAAVVTSVILPNAARAAAAPATNMFGSQSGGRGRGF